MQYISIHVCNQLLIDILHTVISSPVASHGDIYPGNGCVDLEPA